jgi:hypothetical protein
VVILTMFASQSFDPRLMWDNLGLDPAATPSDDAASDPASVGATDPGTASLGGLTSGATPAAT